MRDEDKSVATLIQQSFPSEQRDSVEKELERIAEVFRASLRVTEKRTLDGDDSPPDYIPHFGLFGDAEQEKQEWIAMNQVRALQLSEGDFERLRRYAAIARSKGRREFEETLQEDWDNNPKLGQRGIALIDYNNTVTFVRCPLDEVGEAFAAKATRWEKDTLGRQIVLGGEAFFVFRLRNNSWTGIVHHNDHVRRGRSTLREDWERILSRRLDARVIAYGRGDTASYIGYHLYQSGELLEKFTASEGGRTGFQFVSTLRDLTADQIALDDEIRLADQFFRDEDAYEPGITFSYFLNFPLWYNYAASCAGIPVTVQKPMGVMGDYGGRILERVDYIALAD